MLNINILNVIIGGEWNIIFNLIDKCSGYFWKVISYRNFFMCYINKFNFIDIY